MGLKNLMTAGSLKQWALPLLIPALFFVLVRWVFSTPVFEFDTDEGFNLMKALLLDQGYDLYRQIWSDQPPLFTHVLSSVMHIFGYHVESGRVLVLLSACLLLWSAFLFLRIASGTAQAFLGTLAILWIPNFLKLSYSVMIGLPAIALAMTSLAALAAWHRKRSTLLLGFSALFLGLSVLTKGFTLLLLPIFLIGILCSSYPYNKNEAPPFSRRALPAAVFSAVFALTLIGLIWLLIGLDHIQALLQTHLLARHAEQYRNFNLLRALGNHEWQLFSAALAGSLIALRQRRWLLLYPVSWMTVAAVMLSQHTPVWRHQLLLVTVPAAMLVPMVAEAGWHMLQPKIHRGSLSWRGVIAALLILFFLYDIGGAVLETRSRYHGTDQKALWNWQLTAAMAVYAPHTRWVVTDRPMFAFRSGLPVPPELAVLSDKRLKTTSIEQELPQILHRVQPEQVALARFQWPRMLPYLRQHYRLVYSCPGGSLFLRSDFWRVPVDRMEAEPLHRH